MRVARIITASFMVLLGSMLMVSWSLAGETVRLINDGAAASTMTDRLLASPEVADVAANEIQSTIDARVAGTALGSMLALFDRHIHEAIVSVLSSDAVSTMVTASVSKVSDELVAALTEPHRPAGPFVVRVDLSDSVNARLDRIPVVGPLIPAVTVPPIGATLIDAPTFDAARHAYSTTVVVATWFGWLGLALVVAGAFVVPERRWYWSQSALGVAAVSLGTAFAFDALTPRALASAMPGGASGGAGTFVSTFLSGGEIAQLSSGVFVLATVALALAVLFAVAVSQVPQPWFDDMRARVRAALPFGSSATTAADTGAATEPIASADRDPGVSDGPLPDAPPAGPPHVEDTDASVADVAETDTDATGDDDGDAGVPEASVPHFLPEPVEVVEVEAWPEPRPARAEDPEPSSRVTSREPVAMPVLRPVVEDSFDDLEAWSLGETDRRSDDGPEGARPDADAGVLRDADEDSAPLANEPAAKKPAAKKPAAKKPAAKKPAAKKPAAKKPAAKPSSSSRAKRPPKPPTTPGQ